MHTFSRQSQGILLLAATAVGLSLVAAISPVGAHQARAATPSDFTTLWQDNFDGPAGSAPSSGNWQYDLGPGSNYGTGEIETTTSDPSNVSLDGAGDLLLTPQRDGNGNWTSGRIETVRADFQPSATGILKVEARIQLPDVTGAAAAGYWPAFWMLGSTLRNGGSWPSVGEFDALEDVNGQNLVYGTLHCGVSPGGPCNEGNGLGGNVACPGSPCTGNFHTYTFELDRSTSPQQLRWYVDGQQYWQISSDQFDSTTWNNATNHGVYVILDLAMGGAFPNGVAGSTTPTGATQPGSSMKIDYVSVQTQG
ncbi:MAG: glycoside hydrolase family 16 protein [Jatrophihabitans sp.]